MQFRLALNSQWIKSTPPLHVLTLNICFTLKYCHITKEKWFANAVSLFTVDSCVLENCVVSAVHLSSCRWRCDSVFRYLKCLVHALVIMWKPTSINPVQYRTAAYLIDSL